MVWRVRPSLINGSNPVFDLYPFKVYNIIYRLSFLTSTSSFSWDITLLWEALTSPNMSELDLLSLVFRPVSGGP